MSPEDRGEKWFAGKQCYECMSCGTLVEYQWQDDDSCSCEEEDE